MIFLIDYDRVRGELVNMTVFEDSERTRAEDERLQQELRLHREGVQREVVILQAESEDALRKTHGRYFESVASLVETALAGIAK